MHFRKSSIAFTFAAVLIGTSGCKSVARFDTGPGGAFCGELIEGSTSDGLVPDSDAGAPSLRLALTLDTRHLVDYPGTLTSDDELGGLCDGQRLFDNARVRTVERTLRDVISSTLITQDHEQDIFTWVDSSCQGTFLAIVSLMVDGTVEIRLFKPMKEADVGAPANQRAGFGVFALARNENGCGF